MIADPLLAQLILSPKLPFYVRQAEDLLLEERRRREQFYETMREEDKVEFINGEVVMHSPVKLEHNKLSCNLLTLLRTYVEKHDLGLVGHEKLLICLTRNDYEPDICYFSKEKSAGFTPGQMKFPAPDLIVETLSESTEKLDRGVKFTDYAAHGVGEYWLLDPLACVLEQYVLNGEEYHLAVKSGSGEVKSVAVSGFCIPIRAIFDRAENLKTLQAILSSNLSEV